MNINKVTRFTVLVLIAVVVLVTVGCRERGTAGNEGDDSFGAGAWGRLGVVGHRRGARRFDKQGDGPGAGGGLENVVARPRFCGETGGR